MIILSFVVDNSCLIIKHWNDLSTVVARVLFFLTGCRWDRLLLVYLYYLLLLLHLGIRSGVESPLHIGLQLILHGATPVVCVLYQKLLGMCNRHLLAMKLLF